MKSIIMNRVSAVARPLLRRTVDTCRARLTRQVLASSKGSIATNTPDYPSRDDVLLASLARVKDFGWSMEAVESACSSLSIPAISSRKYASDAMDLIVFAMREADKSMVDSMHSLSADEVASMDATERVFEASRARLLAIADKHGAEWGEAIAIGLQPENVSRATDSLAVSIDEIWHQAGDRSTDLTWYSRRLLLLGAYSSAEIAMLSDESEGFQDSTEYLRRRLNDVKQVASGSGDAVAVARTALLGARSFGDILSVASKPLVAAETGNMQRGDKGMKQ